MRLFHRDQFVARLLGGAALFPIAAFLLHLIIYALPKTLKEHFPATIPLSYGFWDGNFIFSLMVSSFVGFLFAVQIFLPKPYPPGCCSVCGYDLRGTGDSVNANCPECGEHNSQS